MFGSMHRRGYRPNDGCRSSVRTYSPTRVDERYRKSIDPKYVDQQRRTHLHLAVIQSKDDELPVQRVLKAGCDVNAADKDGRRAAHYAAEKGYSRCVGVLAKHKASLDVLDNDGYSPLMLAARHGFPNAVGALARGGAKVDFRNAKRETALHYAVCNGHSDCVEELLVARAPLDCQDAEGNSALVLASRFATERILRMLLEAGANANLADAIGRTPLHWAVYTGREGPVNVLLSSGAKIDSFDNNGASPFLLAVLTNRASLLRTLLDAGCDRDTVDGLNGTALALAAIKGHHACVKVLLDTGDDPDEMGYFGMTPLMSACFESHVAVVETLLRHGASPNTAGRSGATALIKSLCKVGPRNEAARHKIAASLIRAKADVNHRVTHASYFTSITNGKNCALSFAISSGYVSLVRMLLLAGSHVACHEIRDWIEREELQTYYDKRQLLEPIRQWKKNAQPLKHICRMRIRKELWNHKTMGADIRTLPIAPPLQDFVNFADLDYMECERATRINPGDPMVENLDNITCAIGLRALEGTFLHQTMSNQVAT